MTSKRLFRPALCTFASVLAVTVGLLLPASAQAATPRANGPIILGFGPFASAVGPGVGAPGVELPTPGANSGGLAISPDGRQMAMSGGYKVSPSFDGCCEIFVRTLGGGSFRQVTFAKTFGDGQQTPAYEYTSAPAWAPDSRHLVVVHARSLWTLDTKTQAVHRVTTAPKGMLDASPRWSPDGRQIVFVREDDTETKSSLYLVNPDGTGLHRLTQPSSVGGDWYPDWSPDAKKVIFVRTSVEKHYYFPGFASRIMTVTRDGKSINALTQLSQSQYYRWPTWSPDGKQFVVGRIAPYPYGNDIGYSLAIYNAAGHFLHWLRGAPNQDMEDDYWDGLAWASSSVLAHLPKN